VIEHLRSAVTITVLLHSPFGMPDAIFVCVVRCINDAGCINQTQAALTTRACLRATPPFLANPPEEFHIISTRPSKQPRIVESTLGVYSFGLIYVSARTNKRHHHHHSGTQVQDVKHKRRVSLGLTTGVGRKYLLCVITKYGNGEVKRIFEFIGEDKDRQLESL
jgi:hypothetical protein